MKGGINLNLSAERALIATRVYQETEHLPPIARAALGLEAVLEQMAIEIHDWDLIVGNQADGLRASTINPAVNTWIVDEPDRFGLRDGSRFHITEDTKACIRRIIPYWQKKNVYDRTMALLPEDTKDVMEGLVFTRGYTRSKGCGHWLVNMERVLAEGFSGIEARARQLRNACDLSDPDGVDKIPFYDAVIMVCQAVRDFALRYHRLALEKAETAVCERKEELRQMRRGLSETCNS